MFPSFEMRIRWYRYRIKYPYCRWLKAQIDESLSDLHERARALGVVWTDRSTFQLMFCRCWMWPRAPRPAGRRVTLHDRCAFIKRPKTPAYLMHWRSVWYEVNYFYGRLQGRVSSLIISMFRRLWESTLLAQGKFNLKIFTMYVITHASTYLRSFDRKQLDVTFWIVNHFYMNVKRYVSR